MTWDIKIKPINALGPPLSYNDLVANADSNGSLRADTAAGWLARLGLYSGQLDCTFFYEEIARLLKQTTSTSSSSTFRAHHASRAFTSSSNSHKRSIHIRRSICPYHRIGIGTTTSKPSLVVVVVVPACDPTSTGITLGRSTASGFQMGEHQSIHVHVRTCGRCR